jgi:hypothetical protein
LVIPPSFVSAADAVAAVSRVLPEGQKPADARLGALRTLNDAYHPWNPPASKEAWEAERDRIRERLLVSLGLWPMPPKTPLNPVIYGKIDRDDYTIEKVYFASLPGHYVTGNLYRPKNVSGKIPGVLNPHGHWANGRFYDAGEAAAKKQVEKGAEKFLETGARYPLQAKLAGIARLGCTVFFYDMVGYADSKPVEHRNGFFDLDAAQRQQNWMGLQTWNSIRALDFLLSLPEVDASRIGVTGASGGGTQTFILGAIDPRPTASFPAVMVGTAMQGGCVCENAPYLRVGINNVAITSLFAPKPLAMSGADDWTKEIETKGLPEMQRVWSFYGQTDNVYAKAFPQFEHNYNQVAREMMYAWFNKHLKLNLPEPVLERDMKPVPPAELSVWDAEHPLPTDTASVDGVKAYLTKVSNDQFAALLPKDAAGVAEYRRVVGAAARVMLDSGVPSPDDIAVVTEVPRSGGDDFRLHKLTITRAGAKEEVPVVAIVPPSFNGQAVLWLNDRGKSHLFGDDGKPTAEVKRLLTAGLGVVGADVFQTGEFVAEPGKNPRSDFKDKFVGYPFCYNRPLLSHRVHDILTVLGAMKKRPEITTIHLIGTGDSAGTWALLARALAGDLVSKTVVDVRGFGFSKITDPTDPQFLPGALKYGGLGGLAALAAPANLTIAGSDGIPEAELQPLAVMNKIANGRLVLKAGSLSADAAAEWLLK